MTRPPRHMKGHGDVPDGGPVTENGDPPVKPTGQPASVFAGRGAFLAWDWASAGRLKGALDWVAVQADGSDEERGPWATPDMVAQLRLAGFDVHAWYSWDKPAVYSFTELGVTGFVGQAESESQRDRAQEFAATLPSWTPRALISNGPLALGYDTLAEEYWNERYGDLKDLVGSAVQGARNLGATGYTGPAFGLGKWGTSVRRVPLADYCQFWGPDNFSVYVVEDADDEDVAFLKGLA